MSAFSIGIGDEVKAWGDFELLPPGLYLVQIEEVQPKHSSRGSAGAGFRSTVLQVIEVSGEFGGNPDDLLGRTVWDNIYQLDKQPTPDWLKGRLKMMFLAAGIPPEAFASGFNVDEQALLGLAGEQVAWRVTIDDRSGTDRNNVTVWKSLDSL